MIAIVGARTEMPTDFDFAPLLLDSCVSVYCTVDEACTCISFCFPTRRCDLSSSTGDPKRTCTGKSTSPAVTYAATPLTASDLHGTIASRDSERSCVYCGGHWLTRFTDVEDALSHSYAMAGRAMLSLTFQMNTAIHSICRLRDWCGTRPAIRN